MAPTDDQPAQPAQPAQPDPAARALREFLLAVGAPVDTDPELAGTAERAARAFRDELLDGYRLSARDVLAEALPTEERGLVAVTHVGYTSFCPHHLLPASGTAHLGYLPGARIVGIGTLVRLLDALAHRLVLQESLGRLVAVALVEHLGARAAGVMLQARHTCLAVRGERQADAVVVTQSFAGLWADDVTARAEFFQAISHGVPGDVGTGRISP